MSTILAWNTTRPSLVTPVCLLAILVATAFCYFTASPEQYWMLAVSAGPLAFIAMLSSLREAGQAKFLLILLTLNVESYATFLLFLIPGAKYGAEFQQLQRLGALIEGIPLIVITSLVAMRHLRNPTGRLHRSETLLVAFGIGNAVLGVLMGLAMRNDLIYLIGDTYKLLVIPFAFFLTLKILETCSDRRVERTFHWAMCFFTVVAGVSGCIHIYQLMNGGTYLRIGGYEILPMTYWLVRWVQRDRLRALLHFGLLGFLFICAVLSISRVTWIQTILLIFVSCVIWGRRFLWRGSLLLFLVSLAIIFSAFVFKVTASRAGELVSAYYEDFTRPMEGGMGASTTSKVYESESVFEAVGKWPSLFLYLTGTGSGAEFQANLSATELWNIYGFRGGQTHNIHQTLLAIFYRHGLVGLVLFAAWATSTTLFLRKSLTRVTDRKHRVVCATVYLFWLLSMVKMLSVSIIIGDASFGFLLGTAGVLFRRGSRYVVRPPYAPCGWELMRAGNLSGNPVM